MKYFLRIFFFILLLYSCTKSSKEFIAVQPSGCDSAEFSYSRDIKPIISSNCSGATCHSGGNNNYDFSTYGVLADRIRQQKVEYRLLLPADDPQHMPEKAVLNSCNLYKVLTWIHQGFPDN
jgi:hypothetical protein